MPNKNSRPFGVLVESGSSRKLLSMNVRDCNGMLPTFSYSKRAAKGFDGYGQQQSQAKTAGEGREV